MEKIGLLEIEQEAAQENADALSGQTLPRTPIGNPCTLFCDGDHVLSKGRSIEDWATVSDRVVPRWRCACRSVKACLNNAAPAIGRPTTRRGREKASNISHSRSNAWREDRCCPPGTCL